MAYCSACQIEVASGKFCTTCGRQLVVATAPAVEGSAPAVGQGSAPVTTSSNNLAMWAHLAPLLGAVVGTFTGLPYVLLWLPALLIRQSSSATDFDRRHATESLNFQLSLLVYIAGGIVFSIVTVGIGLFLAAPALVGISIAAIVFNIMGISAANSGREYRYPLTIRFVK